jgi:hypothetical protein
MTAPLSRDPRRHVVPLLAQFGAPAPSLPRGRRPLSLPCRSAPPSPSDGFPALRCSLRRTGSQRRSPSSREAALPTAAPSTG